MKIESNCIKFKSEPEMYELEQRGSKPNTVRVLNLKEYNDLIKHLNVVLPGLQCSQIEITNSKTGHVFRRPLLSIVNVSKHFDVPVNKTMIVFSWSPFHSDGDER
jgi:hypothetical protein